NRIHLQSSDTKDFTVILTGKFLLPAGVWKAGLELPRPLGTQDRGGLLKIVVDENLELLSGDSAMVEQAPGKQSHSVSFDQAPTKVDFAWRPFRPEFPVSGVADITIHHGNAHVRQLLQLPRSMESSANKAKEPSPLLFRIPPQIKGLKIDSPERLRSYQPEKGIAWILPLQEGRTSSSVVVEYDLVLPAEAGVNRSPT